ncbi:HAD family hydrolase [Cognatishimia sp. SS12]|uniref:HAD family hydrolase n=1 Tax=Cognatishimia sp. SS12 TaxID=2979465 RepID=UPI00232BADA9|nr:HAD family hydrolase [Cognatishimia sp. SS12]MDC0736691.1 HAD family hydrolase [Cognatishimia sp. SS12]
MGFEKAPNRASQVSLTASAVLFDKDGTLFDFNATWNGWTIGIIDYFSGGDADVASRIAAAIEFDLGSRQFLPTSPVIAGTNREAAELVASALPGQNVAEIEQHLAISASRADIVPAVPLSPYLNDLRSRGLKLGVMTNDTEMGAKAHLEAAGVIDRFDMVIGHDSGFGAKPDAAPLLAFAQHMGLAPHDVIMVGDSTHDLLAGRRAGMKTIGVLTGLATEDTLAPLADIVLPHIGHIPSLL